MSTDNFEAKRPPIEINAVLERLARLTGSQSDAALAEALDTSRQVISGWRKRGTIPYEKLIGLTQDYEDISLNYLLWGEEPAIVEVPIEGSQVSAQILEVIGGALLDAAKEVRAERGKEFDGFMEGPQIFAFAALVYNRTVDQLPPGQIWNPAIDKEIEHIVEIVRLDFERQKAQLGRRGHDENVSKKNEDQEQGNTTTNSNSRANASTAAESSPHQEISGEGHQIAGGNIENSGGVRIGRRYKK
tara:strand:+ start:949 stop:1683 length:735 start_codon:yes stop_codon:yes gene_type:complete